MKPVSFSTPISFDLFPKKTHRQRFIQAIDGYLYLKGKKAFVLNAQMVNRSQPAVIRHPPARTKGQMILLAVKISSYVIFVLPLIALAVKAHMRSWHRFHIHLHKPAISQTIPLSKYLAEPKILVQDQPLAQVTPFIEQVPPIEEQSPQPPPFERPSGERPPLRPNPVNRILASHKKPEPAAPIPVRQFPALLSTEAKQAALDLKNKFNIPKKIVSELRNRRPKVSDIISMQAQGLAIDQAARALQQQLHMFQGESGAVQRAKPMLDKLRQQIAKASEKSKKLTGLYDCWGTSFMLEGMFLGKKQAALDYLSATIEKHIQHLDALIQHA